jgi:hypothetical protein
MGLIPPRSRTARLSLKKCFPLLYDIGLLLEEVQVINKSNRFVTRAFPEKLDSVNVLNHQLPPSNFSLSTQFLSFGTQLLVSFRFDTDASES